MDRVPEPELMDDPEQALAYAQADFDGPHSMFIELFRARFGPDQGRATVLDLGCGPGDITIRFARAFPGCRVVGIDGAQAMLALARETAVARGLTERVHFVQGYIPGVRLQPSKYSILISNSLLHHLRDPMALWCTVRSHAMPRAALFVMDLLRPLSVEAARDLVHVHAAREPALLRQDFLNSLCAAYRVEEVQAQLESAGLAGLAVEPVSDRHLLVWGRLDDHHATP